MRQVALTGRVPGTPDAVWKVLDDPNVGTSWLARPLVPAQRAPAVNADRRAVLRSDDSRLYRDMRVTLSVLPAQPGTRVVIETSWDSALRGLAGAADELIVRPRVLAAQRQSLAALADLLRPTTRAQSEPLSG